MTEGIQAAAGFDRPRTLSESLGQAKTTWRNPAQLQLVKAENGWVVHCSNLCWVAADTTNLVALVQVLAEDFEEKDVTL